MRTQILLSLFIILLFSEVQAANFICSMNITTDRYDHDTEGEVTAIYEGHRVRNPHLALNDQIEEIHSYSSRVDIPEVGVSAIGTNRDEAIAKTLKKCQAATKRKMIDCLFDAKRSGEIYKINLLNGDRHNHDVVLGLNCHETLPGGVSGKYLTITDLDQMIAALEYYDYGRIPLEQSPSVSMGSRSRQINGIFRFDSVVKTGNKQQ